MGTINKIKHFYSFEDGDTITPGMGVKIDTGYGLQEYIDPNSGEVIATKFKEHNATLFPQAYSSKKGAMIVPETEGQQWYYNVISDEGAILSNGKVKDTFADRFAVGSVEMNGNTFPALIIKGQLSSLQNPNDKYIYYVSSYQGRQFTCQKLIQVQKALGEACQVLISVEGASGSGDEVLSNDNDWILYTVNLQRTGISITSGVTVKFQKLVGSTWQDCKTIEGDIEIGSNTMKLYDAAVDGSEQYRAEVTYNERKYYGLMNPTDEHDPFYIEDGCNINGDAVRDEETVTFNPVVYERSTGEVSTGWAFTYTLFERLTGNIIEDVTLQTLTGVNIRKKKGINVRIEASRE